MKMCHSMKLWERLIIEARLRQLTSIDNTQYGFRPGKSTTEPIFILLILQEKYREMNKELHMVFVGLEKAYDQVVIRPSTPGIDMVVSPEERCPRGVCYDYTRYIQ